MTQEITTITVNDVKYNVKDLTDGAIEHIKEVQELDALIRETEQKAALQNRNSKRYGTLRQWAFEALVKELESVPAVVEETEITQEA